MSVRTRKACRTWEVAHDAPPPSRGGGSAVALSIRRFAEDFPDSIVAAWLAGSRKSRDRTSVQISLDDRDVPSFYRSLEHLVRYCARPAFAVHRLTVLGGRDGKSDRVRYTQPCHKRGQWIGPGRTKKSTTPDAQGVINLSHVGEPVEPPPVSPARGPPTQWNELVQVHDDREGVQGSLDEFPVIDIRSL